MKAIYSERKLYERSYQLTQSTFLESCSDTELPVEHFDPNPADHYYVIFCVSVTTQVTCESGQWQFLHPI